MGDKIRVVLVDECEISRQGLRSVLESERSIKVVGEYAEGEESPSHVGMLAPDVVLLGTSMPGVDTIEVARRFKEKRPDCKIIILNQYEARVAEGSEDIADHYLPRDAKRAELIKAINQCYQSKRSLDELGFVKEVELVIPPAAGANEIMGFIGELEKALEGNIKQTAGSRDLGTVITIMLKPMPLTKLVDNLWGMPYVGGVEHTSTGGGFSGFVRKVKTPIWSTKNSPPKRLQITLNGHEPEAPETTVSPG